MKKVLSAILAAAMVMGMTVSASAANFFGAGSTDAVNNTTVNNISWESVVIVNKHGVTEDVKVAGDDYKELNAGDTLYFQIMGMEQSTRGTWEVDKDWVVKVNDEEFVEDVDFFYSDEAKKVSKKLENNVSYVKVVIADDFDHYAEDGKTNFWFYIYDTTEENKQLAASEKAHVKYSFDDYAVVYLCSSKCELKHKDDRDDVKCVEWNSVGHDDEHNAVKIDNTDPAMYVLCDCAKCYTTSQNVMFFVDVNGDDVYFNAKMIPGEEYLTTAYAKFDKALTKSYDYDMYTLTIDTELKVDAVFESAKDNKVVLEVVDGELYEVESKFVEKYEVIKGKVLTKGYKVENLDNGTFVLVKADADLDWEDTTRKEVVEAPAADDKANPSTGANDFVGAAVALAVVSVAAAGALAFKK